MSHFYIYIFLLVFIILGVSLFKHYWAYKETFQSSTDAIVLLGDSILKNDSYVKNGKSITQILLEKTGDKTYCYAQNDATISSAYSQIGQIPLELNIPSTTLFLSIGGNDILQKYVESSNKTSADDFSVLNPIFAAYKNLVKAIQARMNLTRIVLVDLYYPNNSKFTPLRPMIAEWNRMLNEYASENNGIIRILKISSVVTASEDFTLEIEPSEKGGEKIASSILANV